MLSQNCILVSEEFGDEPCELPLEDDGTLSLSTLNSCFFGAAGLKFRNPLNNCLRAVKSDGTKLFSPGIGVDGWDSDKITYFCVFPKISDGKTTAGEEETEIKPVIPLAAETGTQQKTVDLIILNLHPYTTEDTLKSHFETNFGPLLMLELKRDRKDGRSRRFAFIRFKNYKDQLRALGQVTHKIDGHQARIGLPDFRDATDLYNENKCFVGRVNENIKADDLREFFSQFGEVIEVSYPKKFKGYAFITFLDQQIAKNVCGQDFIIKGYSVCVSRSTHGKNQNEYSLPYNNSNHSQGQYNDWVKNDQWSNGWFKPSSSAAPSWDPWATPSSQSSQYNASSSAGYYPSHGGSSMLPTNVNPMMSALSIAMSNMMKMQTPNNYVSSLFLSYLVKINYLIIE